MKRVVIEVDDAGKLAINARDLSDFEILGILAVTDLIVRRYVNKNLDKETYVFTLFSAGFGPAFLRLNF